MLRKIFGPKRDEVTEEWRRLHEKELNELYFSPYSVRMIKSRRIRWAGHVARMEGKRCVYRVLVGKSEGKRPLGRPRRRREHIILRWIFRNWDVVVWTGLSWLRIETSVRHF